MICPACNYMMTAFDKECPRCHGQGPKRPSTTPPGQSSSVHLAQTLSVAPPPTPATQPYAAPPATYDVTVLPGSTVNDLSCVVCGNVNTQKVSAVIGQGNWASTTVGASVSVGRVQGARPIFGTASNVSESATSTRLATMLAPPPEFKQAPYKGHITLSGVGAACCGGLLLCLLPTWLNIIGTGFNLFALFIGTVTVLPLLAGMVFLAYRAYQEAIQSKERYALAGRQGREQWERAMQKWDQLFYCSRCDHVYNIETAAATPAAQMHTIL